MPDAWIDFRLRLGWLGEVEVRESDGEQQVDRDRRPAERVDQALELRHEREHEGDTIGYEEGEDDRPPSIRIGGFAYQPRQDCVPDEGGAEKLRDQAEPRVHGEAVLRQHLGRCKYETEAEESRDHCVDDKQVGKLHLYPLFIVEPLKGT